MLSDKPLPLPSLHLAGTATCTQCPIGQNSGPGASSCGECQPGSYADQQSQGVCKFCSAGFYQPSAGKAVCLQCPPGTFSYQGASVCYICPRGSITYKNGTAR